MPRHLYPDLPLDAEVELRRDLPELGLKAGDRGVICGVIDASYPYEVRFAIHDDGDFVDISPGDLAFIPPPGDAPLEVYRQHLQSVSGELFEHLSTIFGDAPGRRPAPWHGIIPAVHAFGREAEPATPVWYAFSAPNSTGSREIIALRHSSSIPDGYSAANSHIVANARGSKR